MSHEKFLIKVPGSTSNLGPGFDSIGLAVNRYLTLEVSRADAWHIESSTPGLENLPVGKENLIYQAAEVVAKDAGKELPPCHIQMTSELPVARGLGSSAAAIVAGIELADYLLGLDLTKEQKARYGSLFEGHPDNVSPSVYGGLIIASHSEEETNVISVGQPDVEMVVMIPSHELKTSEARSVLPESLPYKEAVEGSSISNVLVAAMLTGDWKTAGKMMERDLFHQPYRMKLVPALKDIVEYSKDLGVYGVVLSGAGPTVIGFVEKGHGEEAAEKLREEFPEYLCDVVTSDSNGVVTNIVTT
jgi:homoserine kinase